jgi:hypothetical protein
VEKYLKKSAVRLMLFFGMLILSGCVDVTTDNIDGLVPNIAVYSENHRGIENAVLNILSNSLVITNTNINAAMEGYEGLEIKTGSLGWMSFDYSPAGTQNLKEYKSGYLNFTIKTTSSTLLKVGIASGTNEEFIGLTGMNAYTNDGFWHTISIPISSFSNINPANINKYFIFTNDSAVSAGDIIYIDDIFWSSKKQSIPVWHIIWSDEFNSNSINTNNWVYDTGAGGWGNNELENYTATNAYISNNILVIPSYYNGGPADSPGSYTSSRMKTLGKFGFQYGRAAAKIRMDVVGQNAWPAFWMMGTDITTVGWPTCGEIDVMECGLRGDFTSIGGTAHWDDGGHVYRGGNAKLTSGTFADAYHYFEVEWTTNKLIWRLDGKDYFSLSSISSQFQHPFFILLNLAIGSSTSGYTGNKPVDTTMFPKYLDIDWVRVYQLQ